MKRVSFSSKLIRAVQASLAGVCLLAVGDASARALVDLDFSVMTGNTVQVVFTFDEAAAEPRTFTIDHRICWSSELNRSPQLASSRRPLLLVRSFSWRGIFLAHRCCPGR